VISVIRLHDVPGRFIEEASGLRGGKMRITRFVWLGLLAAPLVCAALPVWAQGASQGGVSQGQAPPSDSNIHFQGMLKKDAGPAPPPPRVAAPPSAWPRLDPGSVLCRSQDDLQRRAALMRGDQVAPPDCQSITQPTAITILDRVGPGATEVQVTSNSQTGWTDAWLPATPPLSAANR
jgi:hypothetical protein